MHTNENTFIDAMAQGFYQDAIEIAKDDPSIRTCAFESFCRAMWSDDHEMNDLGVTREDYRHALQIAWEKVHV